MENTSIPSFAFFGTPDIAVTALNKMQKQGFIPELIICNPDAPVGRKQIITPPPTKVWAESQNIPVFQPKNLKDKENLTPLTYTEFDFFVVLAYGKIMPAWLIDLPKYGTINAHPSLLPKFRGASPIRSTLLHDLSAAGVTIMQMDAELDHGPILKQQAVPLDVPIRGRELDSKLATLSGTLLVETMQEIIDNPIVPIPQEHHAATYCSKISKDMAEVHIDPLNLPSGRDAYDIYRKFCAFDGWPGVYFLHQGKRIKITDATYNPATETIVIHQVIPEGKKAMPFSQYFKV